MAPVTMTKTVAATAALATALSLVASTPAHADVVLNADTDTVDVSYRSHILLADGAAVAMLLAAGASGSEGLGNAALATGALGGPLVHLAHGNPGRALGSLALRTGLTYGGLALGAASCTQGAHDGEGGEEGWECLGSALVGGMVGYGAAAIIDATVLGHQTRRARPLPVAPQLGMTRTGMQVGISGTF